MTLCRKCGLPLAFKKLANGKWSPTNPDGSDHWDLCRQTTRSGDGPVKEYMGRTGAKGYVWCGPVPPWDESLGEYRPFTKAEIQAGEICMRMKS